MDDSLPRIRVVAFAILPKAALNAESFVREQVSMRISRGDLSVRYAMTHWGGVSARFSDCCAKHFAVDSPSDWKFEFESGAE